MQKPIRPLFQHLCRSVPDISCPFRCPLKTTVTTDSLSHHPQLTDNKFYLLIIYLLLIKNFLHINLFTHSALASIPNCF